MMKKGETAEKKKPTDRLMFHTDHKKVIKSIDFRKEEANEGHPHMGMMKWSVNNQISGRQSAAATINDNGHSTADLVRGQRMTNSV